MMLRLRVYVCLFFGLFGGLVACKNKSKTSSPGPAPVQSTNDAVSDRPSADLDKEGPFLLIPKVDDNLAKRIEALPQGTALNLADPVKGTANLTDFYIGINKKELDQPWFLTASTKQLYPSWYASPYFNLGTRVVKFTLQNGKIFVFDIDRRRTGSSISNPTIVVDAYPIVPLTPQLSKLGLDDTVVIFDPAAGLSQHGPMSDLFARVGGGEITMSTDIQYLRRFNKVTDGIYYEMVFSGVTNVDLSQDVSVEAKDPNPTRVVGTLGLTLRRYKESPGFGTLDASELNRSFYFTGSDATFGTDATRNSAQGGLVSPVLKWGGIKPGMNPIVFKITPQINNTQMQFPEYDVLGALKRGVESWNAVFGFPVFKVVVGNASDSWASDDSNMIIWDDAGNLGYAYADARINPATGEIRGANIYMDAFWVFYADDFLSSLPLPGGAVNRPQGFIAKQKNSPRLTGFSWGNFKPINLCNLKFDPKQSQARQAALVVAQAQTAAKPAFNRKIAVENYVANVIAHEAGHVLGLRHNFRGSTFKEDETSSIMDYYDDYLSAVAPNPAVYDIEAIKFLYGQKSTQPTQAFCTDEQIATDPLCRQFDFGVDPLQSQILPSYQMLKKQFINTGDSTLLGAVAYYLQQSLDFFQGGNAAQQTVAWEGLIKDLRAAPLATGASAPKPTVNTLAKILVDAAFITADRQSSFAQVFIAKPDLPGPLATVVASDLAAMALNPDGIRVMDARRLATDALKKMQMDAGLQALTKLKTDLTAKKASLTGPEAVLEGDLLTRVEQYLTPYFD